VDRERRDSSPTSLARLAHQSPARRLPPCVPSIGRLTITALLVAVAALAPFAPVPTASAAIIVVNSLGDAARDPAAGPGVCKAIGSNDCTLRAALVTASTTQVDQIVFDPAVFPPGSDQIIIRSTPSQLTVDRSVVIRGPTNATVRVNGPSGRVFEVAAPAGSTVQITDLRVQNGILANGNGGGIAVTTASTLVLERVIVEFNLAERGSGGGLAVEASGAAILRDVIVNQNWAEGADGGGLFVQGALDAERPLVTNNTAGPASGASGNGGGIAGAGRLRIVNATMVGNTAASGGGIHWTSDPSNEHRRIIQSTIARNSNGNIVFGGGGPATGLLLERSIVANPQSGQNCAGAGVPSAGDNVVVSAQLFSTDTSCLNASIPLNDKAVSGVTRVLDPFGLRNNGGFSPTIALDPGSQPGVNPALDGVTHNACPEPETDQRNITRKVGSACDVGAFEAAPPQLTLSDSTTTFTEGTPVVVDGGLTLTRGAGDLAEIWHATVEIVAGFQQPDEETFDTLTCPVCTPTTVASDFDVLDGLFRLKLDGGGSGNDRSATAAEFQVALRSVTFNAPGDAPATTPRTILITIVGPSTVTAYRTIQIQPQNDPLTLATNGGLIVGEGFTSTIGSGTLRVSDVDTPPTGLVYTVTALPTHGQLRLNGTAIGASATFTQNDVDFNRLDYAHDGSEAPSDGFTFTVTDGTTTLAAATFAITVLPVNDPPTIQTNQGLTLQRGATAPILGTLLATADVDNTPAQLTFTLSSPPKAGFLRRDGAVLGPGGTFTQADVNANRISYASLDTNATTDAFTFAVTDGAATTAPATFAITIQAPVVPPAPQPCTPRPRVQLQTTATPGQLGAIVEGTPLGTGQNNFLQWIRVDKATNAAIRINGTAVGVGVTFNVPAAQVQVQLAVTKTDPTKPGTVELTVRDGCGEWHTFLGGGPNAF